MMLNKNVSQKSNFWKVSFLLPFLLVFIYSFNVKTVAQVQERELAHVSYSFEAGKHIAIITKDAKTEELEKLQKYFAENGVILNFTEVKRSAEGIIKSIALSYKVEKTGNSGSYSQSEPEGIAGYAITIVEGKVSIKSYSPSSGPKHERGSAVLSKIGDRPLIIIAGKEYTKDELNGKNIWIKSGLQVLNSSEASKKYGSKAKDGVIVISQGEIIEDYDAHLKEIDRENKNINREYFWIREDQMPLFATLEKRKDGKPEVEEIIPDAEEIIAIEYNNKSTKIDTQQDSPIFVIEGKIQREHFNIKSLEPGTIKSFKILKRESAIDKYGEKGKNGVIEIDLESKEELESYSGEAKESKQGNGKIYFSANSISFENDNMKKISVIDVVTEDPDNSNRLYIIDGKVMDIDFDPETISDKKIESITVLKGNNAIAKYGEKALNGAIEIITKK